MEQRRWKKIISDNPRKHFIRLRQILKIFMVKEIVSTTWLSQQFQAADDIFNKLYEDVTTSSVFIKIDDSVILDKRQFNRVVKAIREKRQGAFEYEVFSPYKVNGEGSLRSDV